MNQASDDGGTPLYIASQNSHLKIVDVFVAAGASVNQVNNNDAISYILPP